MEGDSVTLNTGVKADQQGKTKWYFNDTRIAQINGDLSFIYVQCKERFRDRLKLDHQTGSLTITNTRNTDSGEYKRQIVIIRDSVTSQNIFSVSVNGESLCLKSSLVHLNHISNLFSDIFEVTSRFVLSLPVY
ncbi:hypothetical protein PO909_028116 [Leuciscus waleckii]